jgi:hypothetical protein
MLSPLVSYLKEKFLCELHKMAHIIIQYVLIRTLIYKFLIALLIFELTLNDLIRIITIIVAVVT